MFPNTCSAKGNLIVCPVNRLNKAVNFSGKILNKVHLYHNPCNILCNIFYTISLGSISLYLDPQMCATKRRYRLILKVHQHSAKFWHLVDNLYLVQFHGPPLPFENSTICLMWSMFLNLWTVFTVEAIVLVSVLTSSAKRYDLGRLQDSYPARRRPSKFCYRNSVTKM